MEMEKMQSARTGSIGWNYSASARDSMRVFDFLEGTNFDRLDIFTMKPLVGNILGLAY